MPTPQDAAMLRDLARAAAEAKRITDLRNATAGTAKVIEAAYEAELAAQARLATTAARLGVPLAEATPTYGLSAAGAGSSGGMVLRGVTALGRLFGGGAAAGTAAALIGTAVLTWAAASAAGRLAADSPVQAGTRTRASGPNVAPFDAKPQQKGQKYYLYAVNTSGWSFYIGRPSDVEGRPSRSFTDGGTGEQPVESKKLVSQSFDSAEAAKEYLRTRVSPGKQSYWTGQWYKFEGAEYRGLHVGL